MGNQQLKTINCVNKK